jgi:hypothetical protein
MAAYVNTPLDSQLHFDVNPPSAFAEYYAPTQADIKREEKDKVVKRLNYRKEKVKQRKHSSIRVSAYILEAGGVYSRFYFWIRSLDQPTGSGALKISRDHIKQYCDIFGYGLRQGYDHFHRFREVYCVKSYRKDKYWVCHYKAFYRVALDFNLTNIGPVASVTLDDLKNDYKVLPIILVALQGQRQAQYMAAKSQLVEKGGLNLTYKKRLALGHKLEVVNNSSHIFKIWLDIHEGESSQGMKFTNKGNVPIMGAGDSLINNKYTPNYLASNSSIYYLQNKPAYGISQTTIGSRLGGISQSSVSRRICSSQYKYNKIHQYVRATEGQYFCSFGDNTHNMFQVRYNELGEVFYFKQIPDLYNVEFELLRVTHQRKKLRKCLGLTTSFDGQPHSRVLKSVLPYDDAGNL